MCRSLSFNTLLWFAQHLVLTAINDNHTEVDSSKRQSIVDGTPSKKERQTMLKSLYLQIKMAPPHWEVKLMRLRMTITIMQEENSIELNTEAILRDEEIGSMQEFHSEMYSETLPEHYPDLAFVWAKNYNDNPILVIPPNGVACHFDLRVQAFQHCLPDAAFWMEFYWLEIVSYWIHFSATIVHCSQYTVLSESKQGVKQKRSTHFDTTLLYKVMRMNFTRSFYTGYSKVRHSPNLLWTLGIS